MFAWIGFKTKWIEFENVNRVAGETKWSFIKLFIYAINGILAFSTVPLVLSFLFSYILAVVSLLLFIFRQQLIAVIILVGSLILFSLGILGQYLAKSYLEVKRRPIYICKLTNIKKDSR